VKNSVGLTDQAVVTVQVGNSQKDINLRLEVTDLNNKPISTIAAGSEFKVRAYVQDIRTSPPDPSRTGVFAVYFDLLYDGGLITTKNDPANRFGFGINFAAPYNSNGLSANNSFVNVIDEVGAFQTGSEALGSTEYLLTQMTFRANNPGVAQFVADPPDLRPFHDILLFEPPAPISLNRINLGVASITVLPAGAGAAPEGEYTNPQNNLDVNGDNFVSPIDVAIIFNYLNSSGAGRLGGNVSALSEGESGTKSAAFGYVDVNADGYATPSDALWIINYLNAGGHPEGEGSSVLLANALNANSSQSRTFSIAPSLAVDTVESGPSLARRSPASSVPNTSAVDTLFYHHSQNESTPARRDVQVGDASSTLVSDDLLELLADRNANDL
jgi:hypothetical protein